MNKLAAIYPRVSSEKQRESHLIASQAEAMKEFARTNGYQAPEEWVFEDDGYSEACSSGLEQVQALAASGQIQAALVLSPDRLSRKYAYQVFLMEEFSKNGGGDGLRPGPPGRDTGGTAPSSGAGDSGRIRMGADPGAIPTKQAPTGEAGRGQRSCQFPLRVPVRQEDSGKTGIL
jgi:hypothetical protein